MSVKKTSFFIIIIASIFIINNLVRSIFTLWQKNGLVENVRNEVQEEKERNMELKNKLSEVEDRQFVEEEARNKLFMVKPGEAVVVLPQKVLEATISAKQKPKDTRPNWKKWYELFF
jgi:cell division protein FtsB